MKIRFAALWTVLLTLVGCSDFVWNSVSPEETRRQVIDVSRQIVSDLGAARADLTEAQFSYRSCGFNGKPPFQGVAHIALWMPGEDRSQPVSAAAVMTRLREHGWAVDPDFHTHASAFKRDGLNVKVYVIPPLNPDQHPVGHVMIDVLTECQDTFDHRTDRSAYTATDITSELAR